jgi:hypothetical protein
MTRFERRDRLSQALEIAGLSLPMAGEIVDAIEEFVGECVAEALDGLAIESKTCSNCRWVETKGEWGCDCTNKSDWAPRT